MMRNMLLVAVLSGTILFFGACGKDESSTLVHRVQNNSSVEVEIAFPNGGSALLLNDRFVIAPGAIDTLIFFSDLGETVAVPECGIAQSVVTVADGRTLAKDLNDAGEWNSEVSQDEGFSRCTFVIEEADLQ